MLVIIIKRKFSKNRIYSIETKKGVLYMQQIKKEIFELNKQFEKLKENNQLEVKEAFYGIPSSI